MKKRILTVCIVLFVVFLAVAAVFFFLMKSAETDDSTDGTEEYKEYDVSHIVEKVTFLKLNTYDEIKDYVDKNPIGIQTSDGDTVFSIGGLNIEDNLVSLFYTLNEDGSINRFDGKYSIKLNEVSADGVWNAVSYFDHVIVEYFGEEYFDHDMYDENGMPINSSTEEAYGLMLEGKAKYSLSVIDEYNTYWHISAVVDEEKQMNFEFFRCFDLDVYGDDSPNIDLRTMDDYEE